MIGLPYPKYMNSNNDVDQAAALIICSVERARALGVPEDRWVFVHAGSDCHEHTYISEPLDVCRDTGDRARRAGGAGSSPGCPSTTSTSSTSTRASPRRCSSARASLGLPLDRQLTRTGGLSFAGGPWNNYVMHAIATMMNDLREQPGANGLVWANGGYATKHAFGVYSTDAACAGFRHASPQDEIDAMPRRRLADAGRRRRPHQRSRPTPSCTIARAARDRRSPRASLADGRRAWGTSSDRDLAGGDVRRRVGRPPGPPDRRRHAPRSIAGSVLAGGHEQSGRQRRSVGMSPASTEPAGSAKMLLMPSPTERHRIILDCDPGHDDAIAIVVAAAPHRAARDHDGRRQRAARAHDPQRARSCSTCSADRRAGAHRARSGRWWRRPPRRLRPRRERPRRRRPPRARPGRRPAPTPSASSSTPAAQARACGWCRPDR